MAYTTQDYIDAINQDKEQIRLNLNNKLGMNIPEGANFTDIADKTGTYVPSVNLQNKSIEITENGTEIVEADEGYDGLESVEITTNVSGGGEPSVKFTGHYDAQGLRDIGYDEETIAWYQENGVTWNEENDDAFIVSDSDKSYYGNLVDTNTTPSVDNPSVIGQSESVSAMSNYGFLIKYLPFFILNENRNTLAQGFNNCIYMTIPKIDTSNITKMDNAFNSCYVLTTIPSLDTHLVTSMYYMFKNCYSLKTIPLLDTQSVANMSYMFYNCNALQTIPELNTEKVANMSYMFYGCKALPTIPLLNTKKVTTMSYMFGLCNTLKTIPLLDTSLVKDMSSMFATCSALETIPELNTAIVTNMNSMFSYCGSLKVVPLLNTQNVTSMVSMFQYCYSLQTIPLLNTGKVTSMNAMFQSCYSLQTIPLLDTHLVTNMSSMFQNCYSLHEVPLLNTEKVTTMSNTFNTCRALKKFPRFNMTKVTNVSNMFNGCYSLEEIDLSGMNLSKITTSSNFSGMFTNCGTKLLGGVLPKIYVSSEADQTWVLTKANGHPTTWTTDNVIIAGSEQDLREA